MTLFLLACTAGSPPGIETITTTNTGSVCLEAPVADGDGQITVDPNLCLSSSCDTLISATCTATLDGSTITVTSEFVVESQTGDVSCTDDCGLPMATCTVGPLASGTYTITHGDVIAEVTIPTTDTCDPYG